MTVGGGGSTAATGVMRSWQSTINNSLLSNSRYQHSTNRRRSRWLKQAVHRRIDVTCELGVMIGRRVSEEWVCACHGDFCLSAYIKLRSWLCPDHRHASSSHRPSLHARGGATAPSSPPSNHRLPCRYVIAAPPCFSLAPLHPPYLSTISTHQKGKDVSTRKEVTTHSSW